MARRKTVPVAKEPNPIHKMFGTYLRLQRKALDYDSAKVADALGLTDTYYRLVESGRATFGQSLAFKLVALFTPHGGNQSGPASIEFQRLALLLVGGQWVGARMAELGTRKGNDLRAMEGLAENDADFALFHSRTAPYYSFGDDSPHQKEFLVKVAALEVSHFLRSFAYAGGRKEDIAEGLLPTKQLLDLPSLNVEMIVRLVTDLSGRPFVHTPRVASAWEERNAQLFLRVSGVYANTNLILADPNLSLFHYSYLLNKGFRELRFVFSAAGDAKVTKAAFVKGLNAKRQVAGLDPVEADQVKKLRFVHLTDAQIARLSDRLTALYSATHETETVDKYDAYWSFDTTSDLKIGFIGRQGSGTGDIWNLSLATSIERTQEFERLWGDVGSAAS